MDRQYFNLRPPSSLWVLSIIAVDPDCQQQGIGSALLEHSLEQTGNQARELFVLSCNPRNLGVYERFGFERLGRIQAGNSPPLHPLLRLNY
ncbi:GNAT family N-acetyltransferase [Endozoicomonas montiporae]|uniref:GNAT family N-acetyltransferase n=1 Tax=Endozoicomonas montiporae TaxID=1027273 RepID=UPI0009E62DF3